MVLGGSFVGDQVPRAEAACTISTSLRLGSGGGQVRCLQTTLNAQGYNSGPVDGSFGAMTYRAVVRYQQAKRLFVDGVVGRQTGTSLGIWGAAPSSGGATSGGGTSGGGAPGAGTAGCSIASALRRGSSGAQVRCLQSRLTALGYPVGPIDGAFGTMTHNGVVRYQRAKGLLADGIVGRVTGTSLGIWGTTASGGGAPAAAGEPMHATVGRAGCRPSGGRRQLVGKRGRRRPARVQRRSMDVLADGHAGPRRAQRRAGAGQPAVG